MFRRRNDEPDERVEVPASRPQPPQQARQVARPSPRPEPVPPPQPAATKVSRIGQSVKFQGEIHSQEDLYIDGIIEGVISIPDHLLVIGPNSKVQATVEARSLELHGILRGKVAVGERIQIKKKGCLEGDLVTHRLVIEDGAIFRGTSEVRPPEPEPAPAGLAAPQRTAVPKVETAVEASRPAPKARPPAGAGQA